MRIEDLTCPCGEPVIPVHDDAGVFLQCAADCQLVAAPPAPSVQAAVEAWLGALPLPSIEDALENYAYNSAAALAHAHAPQELVALAPLAQTLISFLRFQSKTPAGDLLDDYLSQSPAGSPPFFLASSAKLCYLSNRRIDSTEARRTLRTPTLFTRPDFGRC